MRWAALGFKPRNRALTLVEWVLLVCIIAALAAMLVPVWVPQHPPHDRITVVALEIGQIDVAIHSYEAAYGRWPVSAEARESVAASGEDFTFGGTFRTPQGAVEIKAPGTYTASNSDVMAILLDLEVFGNGQPTVNKGHAMNPKRLVFINAKMVNDTISPGIGLDGVYRDPWGNPYVITLDTNGNGKTRDAFYKNPAVSQDPSDPNRGFNGLVKTTNANVTVFEANAPVMVWSAGPDKMIDPARKANQRANKDNVLSWRE